MMLLLPTENSLKPKLKTLPIIWLGSKTDLSKLTIWLLNFMMKDAQPLLYLLPDAENTWKL